ncbi:hypothetical protein E2P81_ATG04660 [Venturia nashicola]|uniref:Uncharacterized protein n=1 Tax=Venturia nashicola TaxID=86259 RepID=A0A4Z1P4B0_9PEZI|nr:hypothetical protein E6O75_ATG04769 [Venturia nashicola]TLD34495.1 hypothetical protein E2P81_ATG04660 [Venturia nashicola]
MLRYDLITSNRSHSILESVEQYSLSLWNAAEHSSQVPSPVFYARIKQIHHKMHPSQPGKEHDFLFHKTIEDIVIFTFHPEIVSSVKDKNRRPTTDQDLCSVSPTFFLLDEWREHHAGVTHRSSPQQREHHNETYERPTFTFKLCLHVANQMMIPIINTIQTRNHRNKKFESPSQSTTFHLNLNNNTPSFRHVQPHSSVEIPQKNQINPVGEECAFVFDKIARNQYRKSEELLPKDTFNLFRFSDFPAEAM